MRIIVFGATGKVGSLVVSEALAAGHHVIGFVHGSSHLPSHPNLTIFKGDIYDASSVQSAVQQCDVVIGCLGSWGTAKKDVLSQAMMHLIPAMQTSGVTRIVSLTGADAISPGEKQSVLHRLSRWAFSHIVSGILADGEKHIQLLSESNLDWTVIRSPIMNNYGKEDFVLTDKSPYPWITINRKSIARAMLQLAATDKENKSAPFIKRI